MVINNRKSLYFYGYQGQYKKNNHQYPKWQIKHKITLVYYLLKINYNAKNFNKETAFLIAQEGYPFEMVYIKLFKHSPAPG